jgi:imidazolonepropionase-like amidohydrolase
MAVPECKAMKAALGENPKNSQGKNQERAPSTRMATASVLRDALAKATWYGKRKLSHPDETEPDSRWEALQPALRGDMPFKFHAHRSDDIITAIRLADEFGLRYTIDHCTEGYLIIDLLKETWERGMRDERAGRGIAGHGRLLGIVTGPVISDRSKPELRRAEVYNSARLAAAGLPVSIMTDHPVVPVQYLPVSAALAVKAGLPEAQALKAITSTAADLCGAGNLIGRIREGFKADLILLDGHPFDYRSRVKSVWINGRLVRQHD